VDLRAEAVQVPETVAIRVAVLLDVEVVDDRVLLPTIACLVETHLPCRGRFGACTAERLRRGRSFPSGNCGNFFQVGFDAALLR
jgi:hypothetical protein